MFILCEYCDFRCICYDDWMEHLLSKEHQNVIMECIENWSLDLNERSVIITINETTKPERQDICWYFANYGLVCDLFFEPSLEFCVVQLDKRDYVQHALTIEHDIGGIAISLKCKADLSEAEWVTFNSMVRRKEDQEQNIREETFQENHTKLIETLEPLSFDSQVEHFGREVTMKPIEIEIRKKLLEDLCSLFKAKFPECVLCPYGSFVSGLANNTSVLDVYFDKLGQSLHVGKSSDLTICPKKAAMNAFQEFLQRLNQVEQFCCEITLFADTSLSRLAFVHKNTGAQCSFSCESFLPVQTSKLINFLLQLDPRLQNLFLFLKYWSRYHKLTGPRLITSYSLNLLIIVYLAKKKIVPSITVLQSICNTNVQIDGWDASFCDDVSKVKNLMSFIGSNYDADSEIQDPTAHSILQLALGFFEMFAHTDFHSQVVCPTIGDFLPKAYFDPSQEANLPKSMDAYKNWVSVRRTNSRFDISSLLCVQDPFNLSCNVSSQAPESSIWKFQFLCSEALGSLNSLLNSENPKLMKFFQPLSSSTEDLIIDQNKASQITKLTVSTNSIQNGVTTANNLVAPVNLQDFNSNPGVHNTVDAPQFQEDGSLDPLLQAVLINAGVLPQFWPTPSTVKQAFSIQQTQIFNHFEPCHSNDIFANSQQFFNPFLNQFPNSIASQSPDQETIPIFPMIPNQGLPLTQTSQSVISPIFQDISNLSNPYMQNFSDPALFQVPNSATSSLPNQVPTHLLESTANVNAIKNARQMNEQMHLGSNNAMKKSNHDDSTNELKNANRTSICTSSTSYKKAMDHDDPHPPGTSPHSPNGNHKLADAFKANNFVPRPYHRPLFPLMNSTMNTRHPPAFSQQNNRRDSCPPPDSPNSNPKTIIPITVSKPISNYNFGSFEKIVEFPPNDSFLKVFDEHLGNLISEECTAIRLKVLWASFLKDFFTDVWTRSFNFDTTETSYLLVPSKQDEFTVTEIMTYYDSDTTIKITVEKEEDQQSAKRRKLDEDLAPPGTSDCDLKISLDSKYKFTAKSNPLKQRFFDLETNLDENKAFICTANNTFSEARKKIRSAALLESELQSTHPNPLDFEAEVTRRVEAQNNPLLYTCKFGVKISIHVAADDQNVTVTLREIKEDNSPNLWINNITDHIFSLLRETIPKYQLYRLEKWLEP